MQLNFSEAQNPANRDSFSCFLLFLTPHRAGGKVRHCRIQVEGGQFQIGSASFDSLTELVQYYESNPLYRRMKLKYAINDDVLKSIGEVSKWVWLNFDPKTYIVSNLI